jgi:hypothetical protein
LQSRLLPITSYRRKTVIDARALRVARIARQVREGTYYASGREIALKFLLREKAGTG